MNRWTGFGYRRRPPISNKPEAGKQITMLALARQAIETYPRVRKYETTTMQINAEMVPVTRTGDRQSWHAYETLGTSAGSTSRRLASAVQHRILEITPLTQLSKGLTPGLQRLLCLQRSRASGRRCRYRACYRTGPQLCFAIMTMPHHNRPSDVHIAHGRRLSHERHPFSSGVRSS